MAGGESIFTIMAQRLPPPIKAILARYGWGSARWWPYRDTIGVNLAGIAANPFDSLLGFNGNAADQPAAAVAFGPNTNSSPRGSVRTNMQTPGTVDSNTAYIGIGMSVVPNLAIENPAAADLYSVPSEIDRVVLSDESRLNVRVNGVHDYQSVRTRECMRNPTTAEALTTTSTIAPQIDQEQDGILFYTFRDDMLVMRPVSTFAYQLQWPRLITTSRTTGTWAIETILYGYLVENVKAQRGDS